jgi:hypothetical protein
MVPDLHTPGHILPLDKDIEPVETGRVFFSTKKTHPLTEFEPDERETKVPRIAERSRSPIQRYAMSSQNLGLGVGIQHSSPQHNSPSSKISIDDLIARRSWPTIDEENETVGIDRDVGQSGLDSDFERTRSDNQTHELRHISSRDDLRSPRSPSNISLGSNSGERNDPTALRTDSRVSQRDWSSDMQDIGSRVSPKMQSRDNPPSQDSAVLNIATAGMIGTAIIGALSSKDKPKGRASGMEGVFVNFASDIPEYH